MNEAVNTEDTEVEAQEVETEVTAEQHAEAPEDGVEETATSEDADEKPKRKSRAEERINALTREKYEAQRQLEAYQRQVAEYQQYLSQQQAQRPQDDMPKLADFNYDEQAYTQAVAQWNQGQIQRFQQSIQQNWQQQQVQQAQMAEAQKLQSAMSAGQQKYPDFIAKVTDPSLPPLREINPAAFQAVMDSDVGVDVAYYFANNPEQVYALASMSPVQAVKRVAQIEAQLNNKPVSQKSPPKPPSRVSGNSEAVKDPRKMSTDEWMAWRNAQAKR
jgi:chromosome segregation ATPase